MPKAKAFDPILQYLKSKVPQVGMFSTLDELIRASPQERMPPSQWQNYLQPGQMLEREGVKFPLKKEELDYALPTFLKNRESETDPIDRDTLLKAIQNRRPTFNVIKNVQDPDLGNYEDRLLEHMPQEEPFLDIDKMGSRPLPEVGTAQYPEHAHTASVPNSYEENITTSPDFGTFSSHFSPTDLSWSRTTRHYLDPDDYASRNVSVDRPRGPTARLIEEIQSDRHSAGADKLYRDPRTGNLTSQIGSANPDDFERVRRGYRTPEEDQELLRLQDNSRAALENNLLHDPRNMGRYYQIMGKPPDAPFKDPEAYAGLEMRKQLLNAVNQGDTHLALTTGADQIVRYEQGMGGSRSEGMKYAYDTLYPKVLGKLANQYGAPMTQLPLNVKGVRGDTRPQAFVDTDSEDLQDYLNHINEGFGAYQTDPEERIRSLSDLANHLHAGVDDTPDNRRYWDYVQTHLNEANRYHQLAEEANDLDRSSDLRSEGLSHEESSYEGLNNLWESWKQKNSRQTTAQKLFPAMEITPEVAERVKKAGVPLFTLAGATALGLGNNDADASPVTDQAMQNANTGLASGGSVISADPIGLIQLARERHQAYMPQEAAPAEPEKFADGGRVISQLARDLATDVVKNAPSAATKAKVSPVVLAQKLRAGFVDPSELNHLLYTDPSATTLINGYQTAVDNGNVTSNLRDALANKLQSMGTTPPAQVRQFTPVAPKPAQPSQGGEQPALNSAQLNQMLGGDTPGYADGGMATSHEDSLKWIADKARQLGIPSMANDRARVVTGIAKQAYGLDENGQPVLGGRAWLSSQKGTPPAILDELTALPANVAPMIGAAAKYLGKGNGPGLSLKGPQWSQDAQARLDALDAKVKQSTGIGDAHTLPEHIEDAAAMLATPLPAAKIAKEAPMLQRALEYLTPVRPPTMARYATDSGAMGGIGAGIDAIAKRLAARRAIPPETVDPAFEDAAMESTNAQ
jgi:hypothetical protein